MQAESLTGVGRRAGQSLPAGGEGGGPPAELRAVLFGSVGRSVRSVQILDAFSPAVGGAVGH